MTRTRRDFLRQTSLAAAAAFLPITAAQAARPGPNDRIQFGAIGVGGRGSKIAQNARDLGDILAVCDVDRSRAEKAAADPKLGNGKAALFADYRKLLERNDINAVTIGTPDHWHSKICVDAMRAGKDVYCEKPLTLTIEEGKILGRVARETGRVFQVGTQQRSEFENRFLTAVAMVREGRIGQVRKVTCVIGTGSSGGPFEKTQPPAGLDWDVWLGQTPKVDYIKERCHGTFRWWYEYSGGKLTDWGAHHVDIAQWAIGMEESGPNSLEVVMGEHDVPFDHGQPTVVDRYNTATRFTVRCQYPSGVELHIRNNASELGISNGILFEGEKGRFFVSRKELTGEPVEALGSDPIAESVPVALRKGKPLSSHMANFVECCRDRSTPVSDVWSHHRALTTCHLANIALRLNRTLVWDPATEQITGDDEANAMQSREPRKGYEIG